MTELVMVLVMDKKVGDGNGSLACFSPCGLKESDITERLMN